MLMALENVEGKADLSGLGDRERFKKIIVEASHCMERQDTLLKSLSKSAGNFVQMLHVFYNCSRCPVLRCVPQRHAFTQQQISGARFTLRLSHPNMQW